MATSRVIKTSFWSDPWVRKLDMDGKGLYLYLLTNDRTNIAGIYEITVDEMVFETGIDRNKVLRLLRKFGTVERKDFRKEGKKLPSVDELLRAFHESTRADYESLRAIYELPRAIFRNEWMCLTRFIDHQALNPKVTKGIERVIENVPEWAKRYAIDRLCRRAFKESNNSTYTQSANSSVRTKRGSNRAPEISPEERTNETPPLFTSEAPEESEHQPTRPPPDTPHVKGMPPPDPLVVQEWLEAFPSMALRQDQKLLLEREIYLDRKDHRAAFDMTKIRYLGNSDGNRYKPDKIGNVISVFKEELQKLEAAQSHENSVQRRVFPTSRRTNIDVLEQSAEWYRKTYGTG